MWCVFLRSCELVHQSCRFAMTLSSMVAWHTSSGGACLRMHCVSSMVSVANHKIGIDWLGKYCNTVQQSRCWELFVFTCGFCNWATGSYLLVALQLSLGQTWRSLLPHSFHSAKVPCTMGSESCQKICAWHICWAGFCTIRCERRNPGSKQHHLFEGLGYVATHAGDSQRWQLRLSWMGNLCKSYSWCTTRLKLALRKVKK